MEGPNTNSKSFKQAFLKNLLLNLQASTGKSPTSLRTMSLRERKRAIKRGAAGGGARWPKAILAAANRLKDQRCRRIVRRYCGHNRSWRRSFAAASSSSTSGDVARRLVKRRTMALREVIPGGGAMGEIALIREAMDYVVHLRAQVDVLRRLSSGVQRSSSIVNP